MKERIRYQDCLDRMDEHLDALDHLTNTADGSISSLLHMLEREIRITADNLAEFREQILAEEREEEEAEEEPEPIMGTGETEIGALPGIILYPPKTIKEMILAAARR